MISKLHIHFNRLCWVALISFIMVLCNACGTIKSSKLIDQIKKSSCNQTLSYAYSRTDIPTKLDYQNMDSLLRSKMSYEDLNIANAIGVLEILQKYIYKKEAYKREPQNIEYRVELIELSQEINRKIDLASLEISAVASELDCEEEQISQMATYIENLQNITETKLTVGSIILGAIGGIAEGISYMRGTNTQALNYVGFGTGIMSTALGVAILSKNRSIQYFHPRNALKDIWDANDTSTIFPASVWYYLNYTNLTMLNNSSLRISTIERWMSFKQIVNLRGKKKQALIEKYFGTGGAYTSDELRDRADMYDQLESVIKLMKQDLKNLMHGIEYIK